MTTGSWRLQRCCRRMVSASMAGCMYVCSASTSRRVLPCSFSPDQDPAQAVRASGLLNYLVLGLNSRRIIGHEARSALLLVPHSAHKRQLGSGTTLALPLREGVWGRNSVNAHHGKHSITKSVQASYCSMEGCLLLLLQRRQHDIMQVRAGMAPVVGFGPLSQHLGHPIQQVGWRQCSHLCTAKCQALHLCVGKAAASLCAVKYSP